MTLLLDTHTFLWFWWADPQLSATASAAICDPANRKLISPASSWEIAIKGSRNKLDLGAPFNMAFNRLFNEGWCPRNQPPDHDSPDGRSQVQVECLGAADRA